MLADKKKLYSEYHAAKKEMTDFLTAKANVDRLLDYRDTVQEKQKRETQMCFPLQLVDKGLLGRYPRVHHPLLMADSAPRSRCLLYAES